MTYFLRKADDDQDKRLAALRAQVESGSPMATGGVVYPPKCKHCGAEIQRALRDTWRHETTGLYSCQAPDVAYGHLAEPPGTPCRTGGPNPCLGSQDPQA